MMAVSPFVPREPGDVAALIEAYPLAWVVSISSEGQAATPLPLLAETDADGQVQALFGHFARANPQIALLEKQPAAMILFQGPQSYVAPRLVSKPTWGPTWNYAVARFEVDIAFVPEESDSALERLAASLERDRPDPWTVDRMGARYAELSKHIIAFRATVRAAHPRFKLGQDEAPGTFDEIIAGLDDRALADWMTLTVRGR